MKDSEDHSLFVWAALSNEHAPVPPDLAPGRESAHSRHFAFATSPEDFVNMENIAPFVSQEGDPPYNTTNRGLQISLLVGPVRTKYYQRLPMAIGQSDASTSDVDPNSNPLPAANPSRSRSRSRSAGTQRNQSRARQPGPRRASADEDLIQVGVLRCHIEHDFFHVVAIPLKPLGGNHYERQTDIPPGLVPEWRAQKFPRKTIYIKMDDEGVDRSLSFDRRHGLLVRRWHQRYHLREVYPQEYWREKDSIIQPIGMRQSKRP